ncbi:MAG TPA: pseudouridine synthase [Rubrivivax sp.]|nr:rRNA pseudouridine synthase [Burkholderiales bacterium]HNU10370.1 pseudouridine synthase [Rubrivivax sp.]
MSERKTLGVKHPGAVRDPARRPVRGGRRPHPSAARETAARAAPAAPAVPAAPAATAAPAASAPRDDARPAEAGLPRVSRLMTERGLASRREADAWIEAGWVRVDGQLAVLGQRARMDAVIEVDERARTQQARLVTILLHKPIGYVSGQAEDGYAPAVSLIRPENHWSGDRSRQRFHPGQLRGLAPAGRLDIDSTGLLVLTQDGRIARLLIGSETRVEKEYLVRVAWRGRGRMPDEQLERLRHGLELDGVKLRPARVSWQNEDQLRFVLREGRKRQVRRMCDLVGLDVLALKRVRIGSVVLGALPPGQWRYLDEHERFV